MYNSATKSNLKNTTGVDTLEFAKNHDLAILKSDVDELDIDEVKIVQSGIRNLKSKVDKLYVDKLKPVTADQIWKKEVIWLVMILLKRPYITNWLKD